MIKTERSTHVARCPQAVFDFVSDVSSRPQWDQEVISAEWTSEGPIRAGSTYEVVTGFPTRPRSERSTRHQAVDAAAAAKIEPMKMLVRGARPENGHRSIAG